MPKLLVLCDLDRTLFDTALFFEEIWSFAASMYAIDQTVEKARAGDFYNYHGNLYDYRFFDHLSDVVGEKFDRAMFERAAAMKLAGTFMYPDATPDVIGMIDAIVTFGNKDYQEFKLALCPELQGIPRHIVLQPKGQYIHETFHVPSVLIDDKDLHDEIHPPAHFIQVVRSGANDTTLGGRVIRDFSQLSAAIADIS